MAVIAVTGAFGALGRSVVELLSSRGNDVIAIGRKPAPDIFAPGLAIGDVDLTQADKVAAAFREAVAWRGHLDGLVNIAGSFLWRTVTDAEPDDWERMFRTNLLTAALSCREATRYLTATDAAIVNVGAAAARAPHGGMGPYTASKAGVMALTEALAEELRPAIRVNAVLPTIIDTPANRADMPGADISQWVSPANLARVVAFLLSSESAGVTGEGLKVSLANA